MGLAHRSDRLGNLIATIPGDAGAPSVMVFTHMDQLGFCRPQDRGRRADPRWSGWAACRSGRWRRRRCSCASAKGGDVPGVIANKSHHATTPEEKYRVLPYAELCIDTGLHGAEGGGGGGGRPDRHAGGLSRRRGAAAGRRPDRRERGRRPGGLRGAAGGGARAARREAAGRRCISSGRCRRSSTCAAWCRRRTALQPDIAIQIDLMLACDTPDMADRGEVALGGGPGISALFLPRARHAERGDPASGARAADGGRRRRRTGCRCSGQRPYRGADRPLLRPVHGARGRGVPRCRVPDALLAFRAGGVRYWRSRGAGAAAGRGALAGSTPDVRPRRGAP